MKRLAIMAVIVSVLVLTPVLAQEEPRPTDQVEKVEVNLMLVDTVVVDKKGRTVPGLTKEDFVLSVASKPREIETFDEICPAGATDEPKEVEPGKPREQPAAPQAPRRTVMVFDYYHIQDTDRAATLANAKWTIYNSKAPNEEVMLVALANGARIEQRFTKNKEQLLLALERMEYDLTLFAMNFLGAVPRAFFDDMNSLMAALGQYDGPKAVVLYSSWMAPSTAAPDLWFIEMAEKAAFSRSAVYPVQTLGLQPGIPVGGSAVMARMASETGGVNTFRTNDMTLGYAQAQRDLGCRYALGFYLDKAELNKSRKVRVDVTKKGAKARMPEYLRDFGEEARLEKRMTAAVVDPGNFENPYVRGHVFPVRPVSDGKWKTMLALHFRMKVTPGTGDELDVVARIETGARAVGKFREEFHIDPSPDGSPQPVTIYGDADLKPGSYRLVMVVNKKGVDVPQTTKLEFTIPKVPDEGVFLRGPVLARTVSEGVLIRATDPDAAAQETRSVLTSVIGNTGTFQPLMIHQVDTDDTLLALWDVCTLDKTIDLAGVSAERRFVGDEGAAAHSLKAKPLELSGDKVRCQRVLDTVDIADVGAGSYRFEVVVKSADGEELSRGLTPLNVKEAGKRQAAR